jgi:transcriptional regulator with XRE-family HTH domain
MSGFAAATDEDRVRAGRLLALRKAVGLSQQKAAEAAGMDRTHLSNLENARLKFTSHDAQQKLAAAFRVSVGDLVAYAHGELGLDELLRRRGEPKAAANEYPRSASAERAIEYTPRYHNATLALRQLLGEGVEIPPDVAEDVVEGVRLASEEDPPVRFWRASFQQQLKLRTTYRDATLEQIRKHLGGVPVPEEDVARPRRGKR